MFCPGNHDVSRPLSQMEELKQSIERFDDAVLQQQIDKVKLEYFDKFVDTFYGESRDTVAQPLRRGAFVHGFKDLRLSIAALNSCEKESHRSDDHVGLLSEVQAQALMDFWRDSEMASWLKVVAVHHNPTATVPANVESWREWLTGQKLTEEQIAAWEGDVLGFEGKEQLQVQLVLHGHHHAKDQHAWPWKGKGDAHVLSAGSLSLVTEKLPGTEPVSFGLIDLDVEQRELRAKAFVWIDWARTVGDVKRGAFKPDPDGATTNQLDLPVGFPVAATNDPATESVDRVDLMGFVRTFRTAFRRAYSRWDLANVGVTQSGGATRAIDVELDEMYVPLRLGEGYDLGKLDQGEVIEPEDLLRRKRSLAIRGSAGSGKTTWMRWTFRRLLDLEHTLPLMPARPRPAASPDSAVITCSNRSGFRLWIRAAHNSKVSRHGPFLNSF